LPPMSISVASWSVEFMITPKKIIQFEQIKIS
jgi:hypothetical protein